VKINYAITTHTKLTAAMRYLKTMALEVDDYQCVPTLALQQTVKSTGFVQKSACGFPDFSRTKLLLFPDFSRHFVHLYVNKNITTLAFKC